MAWVVQRYITLAGGGTLFDPDPQASQPGEAAKDGAGADIPLVTVLGGAIWADVQVVDDAGVTQQPGTATFDLVFAKRTTAQVVPASGTQGRSQFAWNRGVASLAQAPGVEQWQPGLESPAAAVFVVTGGANVPASGRLAVRIWEGERP